MTQKGFICRAIDPKSNLWLIGDKQMAARSSKPSLRHVGEHGPRSGKSRRAGGISKSGGLTAGAFAQSGTFAHFRWQSYHLTLFRCLPESSTCMSFALLADLRTSD